MSARVTINDPLSSLMVSEWNRVIAEAPLSAEDKIIAKRRLIDKECFADLEAEIGYTRKTIAARLVNITYQLERTAQRLGY